MWIVDLQTFEEHISCYYCCGHIWLLDICICINQLFKMFSEFYSELFQKCSTKANEMIDWPWLWDFHTTAWQLAVFCHFNEGRATEGRQFQLRQMDHEAVAAHVNVHKFCSADWSSTCWTFCSSLLAADTGTCVKLLPVIAALHRSGSSRFQKRLAS